MMMTTFAYPERVRNELRFREITVVKSDYFSGFQRIVFGGEALAGFSSHGFDDHIKLFFPTPGQPFTAPDVTDAGIVWPGDARPPSRDYTPLFDEKTRQLTLDFWVHDGGVASAWAVNARPGDTLFIGGPRGSLVVPLAYRWQLYVCDESGLPALRRRLEALRDAGVKAECRAIVSITNDACKGYLAHLPEATIDWVTSHDMAVVEQHLQAIDWPTEDYFVWITGEGQRAKSLADRFTGHLDPQLVRTVAYWHA